MKNILLIDAAARQDSRTRGLAEHLLGRLSGKVTRLCLCQTKIPALDGELLRWRNACCASGDFSDPYFSLAKQLASADIIVIAAPYWDLSFPAVLKQYVEAVSVIGVTFAYSDEGMPVGLCRAEKLYYVTTSGGPIVNDELGYGYIRSVFHDMYGVKETVCIKAEGLDIVGGMWKRSCATPADPLTTCSLPAHLAYKECPLPSRDNAPDKGLYFCGSEKDLCQIRPWNPWRSRWGSCGCRPGGYDPGS